MKRRFEFQIMLLIMSFLMIPIIIFSYISYSSIKSESIIGAEKTLALEFNNKKELIIEKLEDLRSEINRIDFQNYNGAIKEVRANIGIIKGVDDVVLVGLNSNIYSYSEDYLYAEEIKKSIENTLMVDDEQIFRIGVENVDNPKYLLIKKYYKNAEFLGYIGVIFNFSEYISEMEGLTDGSIRVYDDNYYIVYDNKLGHRLEAEINSLTKKLVDGDSGIEIFDNNLIKYGYFNYLEEDFYLSVGYSMSDIYANVSSLKYKLIAVALMILMLSMLFTWRLIKFIDKKMIELLLADEYKNHEFLNLSHKLQEAIEWIDDVVLHYDELNRLKDELIEINKDLPRKEDIHDKTFIISKYFKRKKH